MAHIIINDIEPRIQYTAAVAQTIFPYPFPIFEDGDLVVDVDGTAQTLTTDYTVSGAGADAGGNVTFVTPMTGGEIVTIYRDVPVERTTDYQNAGDFRADTVNTDFDRIVAMVQQNERDIGRSLRLALTDTTDSSSLSIPSPRANKYIFFDSSEALTLVDPSIVSILDGDVTSVTNLSALQGLTGMVDGSVAVMRGRSTVDDGGQGTFVFKTGDQSSNVTADPGQGVWVAPTSDVTGASGAWQRQYVGSIYTTWFDTYQNTHDFLGANGGEITIPPGSYSSLAQAVISKPNVTIDIQAGAVLDLTGITGTSTSGIYNTVDAIALFKVTGDNCHIILNGRVTGATSSGGANTSLALVFAADSFLCDGSGKIDTLYTSIQLAKNCVGPKVHDIEITTCTHGMYIGSHEGVAVSPEVTGLEISGVRSHNNTNDGLKLGSYTFDYSIHDCVLHNNTRDGLDGFVGGDRGSIRGNLCYSNGIQGIDLKYDDGTFTGTGAGQGGFNRRTVVEANICHSNGADGISTESNNGSAQAVENLLIKGNICFNNATHGFDFNSERSILTKNLSIQNGQMGYNIRSCVDCVITGNLAEDNAQTSGTEGFNFGKQTSGGKCSGLVIQGNIAYGGTGQVNGFSVVDANIENSKFIGNISENHSTKNWNISSSFANDDVIFKDNVGLTLERFITASGTSPFVVAHGLDASPDMVVATVIDSASAVKASVNSLAGSDFAVYHDSGGTSTVALHIASKLAFNQ